MPMIWSDSTVWSESAVGTRSRLYLTAIAMIAYHAFVIYQVLTGESKSGVVTGIAFMCFMQYLFVYALYRAIKKGTKHRGDPGAA